jgi:hypothetical protein
VSSSSLPLPDIVVLGKCEDEATGEQFTRNDIASTIRVDGGTTIEKVGSYLMITENHSMLTSDIQVDDRT